MWIHFSEENPARKPLYHHCSSPVFSSVQSINTCYPILIMNVRQRLMKILNCPNEWPMVMPPMCEAVCYMCCFPQSVWLLIYGPFSPFLGDKLVNCCPWVPPVIGRTAILSDLCENTSPHIAGINTGRLRCVAVCHMLPSHWSTGCFPPLLGGIMV